MSLPRLNKQLLLDSAFQKRNDVIVPSRDVFSFPEKVLQFGTGGFLRAFADYFIDAANRRNIFKGRVVCIQSTQAQRSDILQEQDGLFTVCIQGLERGKTVETYTIVSAISQTIPAQGGWQKVLACAGNPQLEVIISNTTEVGIVLDPNDDMHLEPPRSFPGKLTACLYHRFKAFAGAADKGFIIIACELIEDNATVLKQIVLELAKRWKLGADFLHWVQAANYFCNSLVDRIVPGTPSGEELSKAWERLRYEDQLFTKAETYSLWAIEGDDALSKRLSFAQANPTMLIANDITPYRERKIRILNGTHTITTPVGYLAGNNTVLESMKHPLVSHLIERVMRDEIGPNLDADQRSVVAFIDEVLERFKNPFLKHQLLNITLQSTSKMRVRVIPSILRYYEKTRRPPHHLCFGFAAYLLFMRGSEISEGKVYGRRGDERYLINDDQARYFYQLWREINVHDERSLSNLVTSICHNETLWGIDLTTLPDFPSTVSNNLSLCLRFGVEEALKREINSERSRNSN